MLICSSPQLFAACRVLLRLPMPRHSPCALFSLNFMSFANRSNWFFRLLIVVILFTLTFAFLLLVFLLFTILDLLFLHFSFIQFSRYIFSGLFFCPLVGSSGLEPPTSRLSGACSSLLSYEPVSSVLLTLGFARPLRLNISASPLVEMKRFELLTPCLQGRCSPS